MEEWQEEAVKLGGENLAEKLISMADDIHSLAKNADLSERRIKAAEAGIEKMQKAFPGGDVDGHRRYHEAIIENTEEKRRLRIAIRERTILSLIWALVVGLSIMLWTGFLQIIGK